MAWFCLLYTSLRELFTGTAPIVLTANGLMQRSGDVTYAYSQDASFWYLTGIDQPDMVLVIDKDREYLIIPSKSAVQETFDGKLDKKNLSNISGIKDIREQDDGWEQLKKRLKKVKHVATLAIPPAYLEHYGMYVNPARAALTNRLHEIKPDIELLDLSTHLTRMRMIKQLPEIETIQDAIDCTSATLKEVLKPTKLKKYKYEYEIEAAITAGFRKRGSEGHGFQPIVTGGPRSVTIHNLSNNSALAKDELIIIDVGAEVNHYSADISRTISLNKPSKRQKAVIDAVGEIQLLAIDMLKPGVFLKDYESKVEQIMGEKLRSLGLIKTISTEQVRKFYPHATSHFIGLNVHDIGDYDRPIEPGVILAVEPGIYISAEGIGVRIEDNILITPKGNKILSRSLPQFIS